MNDLHMIRALRGEPQPITAEARLRARHALVRDMHATHGARPRRTPLRAPRMLWPAALATGLALAVGAAYLAQPHDARGPDLGTAPAPASGAEVLHNAALVAVRQPAGLPRPDQFVFTETVSQATTTSVAGGTLSTTLGPPQSRHIWASVDGTGDGLLKGRPVGGSTWDIHTVMPGCRDGRRALVGRDGNVVAGSYEPSPCQADPVYLPALPTDADAMLAWLRTNGRFVTVGSLPDAKATFLSGCQLIEHYYLPAPAKAAVFEAMSRLSGTTVRTGVVDRAGRTGIAVSMNMGVTKPSVAPDPEQQLALIFDATTYALLGTPGTAVLRQSVVDTAGQLPS